MSRDITPTPFTISKMESKNVEEKDPNSSDINRNITDIISMTQAADGALLEITRILDRVKEILAGDSDLDDSQTIEYNALFSEVSNIIRDTSYGGKILLDGSFGFNTLKIGKGSKDTMTFSMPDLNKVSGRLEKINTAKSQQQEAIVIVESFLTQVKSERSKLPVLLDRLGNAVCSMRFALPVESKPNRNSIFLDMPQEQTKKTTNDILAQAGRSVLATVKKKPNETLTLND